MCPRVCFRCASVGAPGDFRFSGESSLLFPRAEEIADSPRAPFLGLVLVPQEWCRKGPFKMNPHALYPGFSCLDALKSPRGTPCECGLRTRRFARAVPLKIASPRSCGFGLWKVVCSPQKCPGAHLRGNLGKSSAIRGRFHSKSGFLCPGANMSSASCVEWVLSEPIASCVPR